MGCGDKCPWVLAKHRLDWEIPYPRSMEGEEFRQIRDLIGEKMKALINDQL